MPPSFQSPFSNLFKGLFPSLNNQPLTPFKFNFNNPNTPPALSSMASIVPLNLPPNNLSVSPQAPQPVPKPPQAPLAAAPVQTAVSPQTTPQTVPTGQNAASSPIQALLSQVESLTPEQKQLLGFGESPEQKAQREGMTASLNRLMALQEQLLAASAPKSEVATLDKLIASQTKALEDFTTKNFLETQPGLKDVGISQQALEREVATRREPIAGALADLLTSRSVLAQQQQQQVQAIQGRISGIGEEMSLRQAISTLSKSNALPAGISSKLLETAFIPKEPEIRSVGNQLVQVDPATGKTRVVFTGADSSGGGFGGGAGGLAASIFANPQLFNNLTPSEQGKIIPTLTSMGFKFPTKLSGEQEKARTNANSGLLALANIKNAVISPSGKVNKSALGTAGIPILGGFTQLDFNRREVTDVISRLRTGAALTAGEEEFYKKQLPRFFDTNETIKSKINQMGALLSGFAGTPVSLKAPDGIIFTADNMFDEQQRLGVRKAIEEGYELVNF